MSEIYLKDNYTNPNIPYLFNRDIEEYDMRRAGISLCKEFKLLDKEIIKEIEALPKLKGDKKLGLLQRNNKQFKEELAGTFKIARQMFFEVNELEDNDIIAIKKDAIFTTKKCKITKIGDNIEFRNKNSYSAFIQLGKKIEIYYNDDNLDVKGISDECLSYHEKYMVKFLKEFIKKMETLESKQVLAYLKRFIDKYKRKELEVGYYREFNAISKFDIIGEEDYDYNEASASLNRIPADSINIRYNFDNILLKLVQIPL